MKFLDRKEELAELERVLNSGNRSRFVVVFGRRRLGKSTLLKKVLKPDDFYYMAGDFVDHVQLGMLKAQIAEKFPAIGLADFSGWEELLKMLNTLADKSFTLCLDEFPYIVRHSPELPSIIQRLIDSHVLKYNIVVCGSSQRMMQNMILSQSEPLFGRADAIIDVQPIPIAYLQEGLGLNGVATVEEFSVWGGVPRYWELREEYSSLTEAISRTMLSPTAVLYDEPKRLFLDDMTATVQSESLLSVVAGGAHRLSEIASRMGRDATSLSAPIDRLISMNYLRREIPFGENHKNSKRSIYQINDPMVDFYYTFIIPNLSGIGRGRRSYVISQIETRFNEYVARHWEYLCREAVSGNYLFGKRYGEASRWWGTVKTGNVARQMEFDVIAESTDGQSLLVGECKWTNPEIATELQKRLLEKATSLPFARDKEIVTVLFLKERVKDEALSGNLRILYPDDVVRMAHGE